MPCFKRLCSLSLQGLDGLGVFIPTVGILVSHFGGKVDGVGAETVQGLPGNPIDLEVAHGRPGPGVANGPGLLDQWRGNQDLLVSLVLVPDLHVNRMGEVMDAGFIGDGKTFQFRTEVIGQYRPVEGEQDLAVLRCRREKIGRVPDDILHLVDGLQCPTGGAEAQFLLFLGMQLGNLLVIGWDEGRDRRVLIDPCSQLRAPRPPLGPTSQNFVVNWQDKK